MARDAGANDDLRGGRGIATVRKLRRIGLGHVRGPAERSEYANLPGKDASAEVDPAWEVTVGDGLDDEAW